MADFIWTHDYGAELTEEPKVWSATFGDGYEQATLTGIHPVARVWSVSFENRLYPEADAILAFIRANHLAFDWVDPDGRPGRWKCASWRQTHPKPLVKTIAAEFEEVFGRD